jgi:AraC family transcriptional regulator, regulatory protein of adaptative response / DNA-3-methyladenine glycosylase II
MGRMERVAGFDRGTLDRARLSRDARFDGKFIIAVRSTGIYCRPICPSPTSKVVNVHYFESPEAAAEAGYRPCLRCRPEAAPGTPAWLGTSAVVRRGLRLINEGFLDEGSVDTLAATVGVGARHLRRLFLQHVGASPVVVAQTRRLQFAKRLIDETDLPMTEIALAAGFGSLRRFNDAFQKTYARAPRDIRRLRRGGVAGGAGEVALRLAFRPPYDWAQVLGFLRVRAVPGVEHVDDRSYRRTVATRDGFAVVQVRPLENEQGLELRVCGAAPEALFQISSAARRMFDLAAEPAGIVQALHADPLLARLVKSRPGLRIPGVWDAFECAVRAIVGQQVSVAAGRTLAARLVHHAGRPIVGEANGLTHLFPSARNLAQARLEDIGLTPARAAALRELARAVIEERLDLGGPSEEVIAAIAALPGCGPWTAHGIALRGLGDPDAFPASDPVLRRLAGAPGAPLSASALEARAEAWRPWRGYAALHLWHAASPGPVCHVRNARATRGPRGLVCLAAHGSQGDRHEDLDNAIRPPRDRAADEHRPQR